MRLVLPVLVVLTLAVSGCAQALMNSGTPDMGPVIPDIGEKMGDRPTLGSPGGMTTREVCRTGAQPAGWIAVQYVERTGCAPSPGGGPDGAILVYIANRELGATVVICADQRTPRGWSRQAAPDGAACEGARVREGRPTAVEIRRISID